MGFKVLSKVEGNAKSEARNSKWFDRPFNTLTAMSSVECLTILSKVEGQYIMTKILVP